MGRAGSFNVGDGTSIGWRGSAPATGRGFWLFTAGPHPRRTTRRLVPCSLRPGPCSSWTVAGPGSSGPLGNHYGIAQEASDIKAVIEATGADVLFGHSYGALTALHSALALDLRALVLYEPPLSAQAQIARLAPPFLTALNLGDYVDAYVTLASGLEILGIPEDKFRWYVSTQLKPSLCWPEIVASLQAAEEELEAGSRFAPAWAAYARLTTPTLVLVGSRSPSYLTEPTRRLADTLAASRLAYSRWCRPHRHQRPAGARRYGHRGFLDNLAKE